MNIEKQFPIILLVGGIGLYFLVSGIMGLLKRRMTVVNPFAKKYPITIHGAIIDILEKKIQEDYKIPEAVIDRSPTTNLEGKDVLIRAWFHIIMGLIALIVLAIFLNPTIFDRIMDIIYK